MELHTDHSVDDCGAAVSGRCPVGRGRGGPGARWRRRDSVSYRRTCRYASRDRGLIGSRSRPAPRPWRSSTARRSRPTSPARAAGRRPHRHHAGRRRGHPPYWHVAVHAAVRGLFRAPKRGSTDRWTPSDLGALGGTRTPNLLIRSQMLYPLSYERSPCSILHSEPCWCLLKIRGRPL